MRENFPNDFVEGGARLMSEWLGLTHTVLIRADGVEWNGKRYFSHTFVAREITGAHRSRPRFFGLKEKRILTPRKMPPPPNPLK
ncbi:DUF2924 domain-containing protein [Methylocystis sp. WRRC1]|uniref:DUF2924 domain-containing protein n=1 Tax=Methylocystis sp. WRRC1 TaxID=1732014 RepID=UPI001D14E371|nr:DUF2924 domain-containing protein [Methylocystis sp. WRRC1]MCC3246080.1 DUF2924 domain-containing protein [Methylocystis sp. WRRC1]